MIIITRPNIIKKFLLVLTLTGITYAALPQKAAKSVYLEVLGPSGLAINYDTRFSKKQNGIGGRLGIGIIPFDDDGSDSRATVVTLPVGINYLFGKGKKNYFEAGAGFTGVFTSFEEDDEKLTSSFGHVLLGYRYQPLQKGFTFRVFLSPVFDSERFIPYYGGVSFGYKF
jgi:hypothetical protein